MKTLWICFTVFLVYLYTAGGVKVNQKVFTQRKGLQYPHLYKSDMPGLTEFTHCMWQEISYANVHCYQTVMSAILEDGTRRDNHYIAGIEYIKTNSRRFRLIAHAAATPSKSVPLNYTITAAMLSGWHKYCYVHELVNGTTWYYKGYMDLTVPGVLEEYVNVESVIIDIKAGSRLGIAIEQDWHTADNDFGLTNTNDQCYSQVSMFNMWNYSMSLDELNSLGCRDQGNIVNMDNVQEYGHATYSKAAFECADETKKLVSRGVFCKKVDTTLDGFTFKTVDASSPVECVKICSYNQVCESANFVKSNSSCQLNSDSKTDEILRSEIGVVHLTPYSCV